MNPRRVLELLARLAMLRYFPAGNGAVLEGLLCLVGDMCESEAQVEWLVKRMISGIYAEWPGPQEMRACYCSRYPPKDGINAYSTVYPEGLPPSRESRLAIAAVDQKSIPVGKVASADEGAELAIRALTVANGAVRPMGGPATPEEIRTAPRWLRELEGYR